MGVGVVGAMMIFYLIWLVHGGFWGGHPPSRYRGTDSRHSFFCPAPVVVVVVVVSSSLSSSQLLSDVVCCHLVPTISGI